MATRTIVTSQPDVACEVCERRLLRGEQPDVFIVAGRRRTVCELCAPRAAHEGWMRETDAQFAEPGAVRHRRGRSLFERLRQVGRPASPEERSAEAPASRSRTPYDFLGGAGAPLPWPREQSHDGEFEARRRQDAVITAAPADGPLQRAVEVFNASEYPRRVAGVARSLGAPEVTVRSAEQLESVVSIVVAWELCWYRYEVDLSDDPAAREQAARPGHRAHGARARGAARERRRARRGRAGAACRAG